MWGSGTGAAASSFFFSLNLNLSLFIHRECTDMPKSFNLSYLSVFAVFIFSFFKSCL